MLPFATMTRVALPMLLVAHLLAPLLLCNTAANAVRVPLGVGRLHPTELRALRQLFRATGGEAGAWHNDTGWNSGNYSNSTAVDPCGGNGWYGVTCTNEPNVTTGWRSLQRLFLPDNGLTGTVPALDALTALGDLNLYNNSHEQAAFKVKTTAPKKVC